MKLLTASKELPASWKNETKQQETFINYSEEAKQDGMAVRRCLFFNIP